MKHGWRPILFATFLCALALSARGEPNGSVRQQSHAPGPVTGSYKVIVGGYYTGTGGVSIAGANLTIALPVKDSAGNVGQLQATVDLVNNRFAGSGTVMGQPMTIEGRLDPADARGQQLRAARIVATFGDASDHHARLAGNRDGGEGHDLDHAADDGPDGHGGPDSHSDGHDHH